MNRRHLNKGNPNLSRYSELGRIRQAQVIRNYPRWKRALWGMIPALHRHNKCPDFLALSRETQEHILKFAFKECERYLAGHERA